MDGETELCVQIQSLSALALISRVFSGGQTEFKWRTERERRKMPLTTKVTDPLTARQQSHSEWLVWSTGPHAS